MFLIFQFLPFDFPGLPGTFEVSGDFFWFSRLLDFTHVLTSPLHWQFFTHVFLIPLHCFSKYHRSLHNSCFSLFWSARCAVCCFHRWIFIGLCFDICKLSFYPSHHSASFFLPLLPSLSELSPHIPSLAPFIYIWPFAPFPCLVTSRDASKKTNGTLLGGLRALNTNALGGWFYPKHKIGFYQQGIRFSGSAQTMNPPHIDPFRPLSHPLSPPSLPTPTHSYLIFHFSITFPISIYELLLFSLTMQYVVFPHGGPILRVISHLSSPSFYHRLHPVPRQPSALG